MLLLNILDMDRELLAFFNGSNSLFLDNLTLTLTSGLLWVPFYLSLIYIIIKNNSTVAQITLIIGCAAACVLTTYLLTDFIVKPYVARWRPTNDPFVKYTIDIVNQMRETKYGFFSAHAANTFSIAIFLSKLFKNKLFTASIITWSLLNCWTRLYLGVHYPLDIACGLIFGFVVGTGYYRLYDRQSKRMDTPTKKITAQHTRSGYYIPSLYFTLNVLATLVCYAIIYSLIRIE